MFLDEFKPQCKKSNRTLPPIKAEVAIEFTFFYFQFNKKINTQGPDTHFKFSPILKPIEVSGTASSVKLLSSWIISFLVIEFKEPKISHVAVASPCSRRVRAFILVN